jgi:tartrate-resistant acid phosphatase type 5
VHEWGGDVVLTGRDHDYERIFRDGIVYFVNGLGGGGIREFESTTSGSQVRYNDDHGAMIVTATSEELNFRCHSASDVLIDEYALTQDPPSGRAVSAELRSS